MGGVGSCGMRGRGGADAGGAVIRTQQSPAWSAMFLNTDPLATVLTCEHTHTDTQTHIQTHQTHTHRPRKCGPVRSIAVPSRLFCRMDVDKYGIVRLTADTDYRRRRRGERPYGGNREGGGGAG